MIYHAVELQEKLMDEENGPALLRLLQKGEWRICERLGLCNAYYTEDNIPLVEVPCWETLVAHLKIVESV